MMSLWNYIQERRIFLITITNYVKATSLEEAYELNQKRENRIVGGMMWLRMSKGRVRTAIDLSGLGLDKIEETEEAFIIGAMCSLRQLETHQQLHNCFGGVFRECVRHIVGVQFRNGATVGGSVFGRFGFSDVLTCLLALDSYVELYKGGVVKLSDFVTMERDNDILMKIIVRKDNCDVRYLSERITATDFPVLACAVSRAGDTWKAAVGARPMKASLEEVQIHIAEAKEAEAFARDMAEKFTYGTNMRGSKEYRRHLAEVLIKRGAVSIVEGR